jgi:hypothetical protein
MGQYVRAWLTVDTGSEKTPGHQKSPTTQKPALLAVRGQPEPVTTSPMAAFEGEVDAHVRDMLRRLLTHFRHYKRSFCDILMFWFRAK